MFCLSALLLPAHQKSSLTTAAIEKTEFNYFKAKLDQMYKYNKTINCTPAT